MPITATPDVAAARVNPSILTTPVILADVTRHGDALAVLGSAKPMSNHVSSIFSRLQVADLAQAIVRARRAGLGSDDGA